jgi:hypothetical protein
VNEPPEFRVWGWPSLGGWLSLLNLAFWVGFLLLLHSLSNPRRANEADWLEALVPLAIFMSLPFTCFLMPTHGYAGEPMAGAISAAILIGVNAFAWGYGLAWLIDGIRKWIAAINELVSGPTKAKVGDR